jgi:hypothetical protein
MKKFTLLAIMLLLLSACQKEPVADRDGRYLVHTVCAKDVSFDTYVTFNIPDSLLVIGKGGKPSYSRTENARALIRQVRVNMEKCGYIFSAESGEADLGIRLTYVAGRGIYPSNSLKIDMLDLTSPDGSTGEIVQCAGPRKDDFKVVWSSYAHGISSPSLQYDLARLKQSIDQSFAQSPYLRSGKKE